MCQKTAESSSAKMTASRLSRREISPILLISPTDAYLLYLAGFSDGDWVYAFSVDIPDLGDGTYAVSVITDRVRPLDFVLGDYRTDSGSTVLRADARPVFAVLAEVRK